MDIFQRLHSGESVAFDDPQYPEIFGIAERTRILLSELNSTTDSKRIHELLCKITERTLDETTRIMLPFHINLGIFTSIGKNVFINHACSFLDIGGITIEDDVLIGPNVSLVTEGHPLEADKRRALTVKPIIVKRNVWIGAKATILAGVTIGENSVIAAGAVVTKDVPANTVAAGVPAKIVKYL